jgi:alpha-L-arabinofuranosidase
MFNRQTKRQLSLLCAPIALICVCATFLAATRPSVAQTSKRGDVRIMLTGKARTFDPQMILGSNLPAWLGRAAFENETFRARVRTTRYGYLRMPGGSFSNNYGWLSCETGANVKGAYPCGEADEKTGEYDWFKFVVRPTDFINFLKATGRPGLWIVNFNATKHESAALVAFMNGRVDDTRAIGVDINGTDWKTVSHWAQLRAKNGNPEPANIKFFDFGNEIYGGKKGSGTGCTFEWGWETSWTCDGGEYINGVNVPGKKRREGYLDYREAMRAVDPSIQLGVAGLVTQDEFENYGNDVIAAGGAKMDYYVAHPYAYFSPNEPTDAEILAKPQTHLKIIRKRITDAFAKHAGGRQIPISLNEYNSWGVFDDDKRKTMRAQINALFMGDFVGQMIDQGFRDGAQWALVNASDTEPGNIYGQMIKDATMTRTPQYWTYLLWSRFGNIMVPVTSTLNAESELAVYAGLIDYDTASIYVINKTGRPIEASITLDGARRVTGGLSDEAHADTLDALTATFNGAQNPKDDLSDAPSSRLDAGTLKNNVVTRAFKPYSITLLRVDFKR